MSQQFMLTAVFMTFYGARVQFEVLHICVRCKESFCVVFYRLTNTSPDMVFKMHFISYNNLITYLFLGILLVLMEVHIIICKNIMQ